MSTHPPAAPARAWRAVAIVLCLLLVLILAAGVWVHWRPVSEDDAARFRAQTRVTAVRSQLHPSPRWLTDDALDRQLDAFGPAPSPAQQRRITAEGSWVPAAPTLSEAADGIAHDALPRSDGDLAATLGAVAASWWAADQAASPTPWRPQEQTPQGGTPGARAEPSCEADVLTALTALDRSGYVAEAAEARLDAPAGTEARALRDVEGSVRTTLEDARVEPLLGCEPRPAAAHYELPAGFAEHPARSAGTARREASNAIVRALAAASPEDRAWLVDALRETARSAQALDPQQPVAALPGRP